MGAIFSSALLSLTLQCCDLNQPNYNEMFKMFLEKNGLAIQAETEKTTLDTTSKASKDYQNKLIATKKFYPFKKWRENYKNGLTQYTSENCKKTQIIFDDLITSLLNIGDNASEEQKIQLFKIAIKKTNQLNEELGDLIETNEREDLCDLTNKVSIACGLDPNKYGGGEGLASEWREW